MAIIIRICNPRTQPGRNIRDHRPRSTHTKSHRPRKTHTATVIPSTEPEAEQEKTNTEPTKDKSVFSRPFGNLVLPSNRRSSISRALTRNKTVTGANASDDETKEKRRPSLGKTFTGYTNKVQGFSTNTVSALVTSVSATAAKLDPEVRRRRKSVVVFVKNIGRTTTGKDLRTSFQLIFSSSSY